MNLPIISLARFEEMLREKNVQIGYRDRRIAELEAERRMLWDKICLLGIGATVFEGPGEQLRSVGHVAQNALVPEHRNMGESEQPKDASGKAGTVPRLPSKIMRRMDRLAEERWLRKVRPAKTAERQRDEVMNELNAAHMDGVKTALPKSK
ncbi:MAG TPA: hypothetical protein VI636_21595 [Candidatus Angelobacter sp.]